MIMFYVGFVVLVLSCVGVSIGNVGFGTGGNILLTVILSLVWFFISSVNIVNEWNKRPIQRLGKYKNEIGPGLCFINPLIDQAMEDVNVYDEVTSIQIESVQTKDNVPCSFELVLTTRVTNVRKAIVEVASVDEAIEERAIASANGTIRAHELSEILGTATSFGDLILSTLQEKLSRWGVELKSIEIKDFKIEDELIRQAIAMKARAQKEAEAELVRAEMQKRIAESLNVAAAALDENGWKLKGLEVLLELCRSANNNTILIPAELQSLAKLITSSSK